MIKIETIEVTSFSQLCRILYCRDSGEAVVVDPGGDPTTIMARLAELKCKLLQIWLTHSHLDHCGAVAPLKREFNCELLAGKEDSFLRGNIVDHASMFGVAAGLMEDCPEPDRYLEDGEILKAGNIEFKAIFVPGHCPGHFCFYAEEMKTMIAGDVLFAGSIGRTDLPGGNQAQLLDGIRKKILPLPGETRVLCGHGPDTTIEREAKTNPYLI